MRIRSFKPAFILGLVFSLGITSAPSAAREMADYPIVKLQSLDKVTARTMTFEANVGSTVKFGPLYIKVQACRKASPLEQPESAAFMQVWEITPEDKAEWVFSGWMFASSPALSYMDHPIYDVWVLDCMAAKKEETVPEDALEGEGQISEDEAPPQPAITEEKTDGEEITPDASPKILP